MMHCSLLAWLGLAACILAADTERSQLAGRVEDPTGAVLVDVTVAAVNEETGIRRTTRTDATGAYVIGGLAPGVYKVTARKTGFQTLARLNVDLAPDRETRLDFAMRIGSIRETVTVEDGPKLLRLDDGSVGVRAGRKLIDSLPLDGRGILSLVELAPGVIATPASRGEAGQFSVNGQRANTNYFSVDGVSANTGVTGSVVPAQFAGGALPAMTAFGGLQNLATLDALQEVRIETSTFAPEWGRKPGAQVSLTTRAGTNEWHGSLSYGFRNEKLAANDWLAASRGFGRSPLRMNQAAGTLGGAARRDRTFVFAAVESLRLRSPLVWLAATPSQAARDAAGPEVRPWIGAFPLPNGRDLGGGLAEYLARGSSPARLDSGSFRIDHALTPRISLFAKYVQAPSYAEFGYSPVEQSDFRSHSLTGAVTITSGASLTNDARWNVSANTVAANWQAAGAAVNAPGNALYGVAIGGLGQLVAGRGGRNRLGHLQLVENLAWNQGAHAIRLGADYDRLTPAREGSALAIASVWPSLDALVAGKPLQTSITQADPASSLIEILSLYMQDTWRPVPKLTLTYGLRWEITPAPSIRQGGPATAPPITTGNFAPPGRPAETIPLDVGFNAADYPNLDAPLWPTRYDQVAPRFGFAWRLSDRSVLRGGGGIFYDLSFSAATDPINGFPYNRWQSGPFPASNAFGPLPGRGPAADLRLPYSIEWNAAYERALDASDVVSVSYVGSAGRRLLRREAGLDPATGLATGGTATNNGASDYHALQVESRRRLSRGLDGIVSYALAHSIDNGSWDSGVAVAGPGFDPSGDRASSSFDVRHSFSAALTYAFPESARSSLLHRLAAGWSVQGIFRARTGFPIDLQSRENLLGLGFDDFPRPNLVAGAPLWLADVSAPGGRRLNPDAFAAAGPGRQGTLGRNAISGFGMYQVDLGVRRRFALGDAALLEIGVQAFNALNHPNLGDPVRYLNSPFFGRSVSMLGLMLGNGSPRSGLTPAFQVGGPRSAEACVKVRF